MVKTKAFFLSIGYGFLIALFCYCVTIFIGIFFNVSAFFGWEHLVAIIIACLIIFPGVGHLYVRHQPFSEKHIWLTSVIIGIFGVCVSWVIGVFLLTWNGMYTGNNGYFNSQVLFGGGVAILLAVFFARGALHFYFYFLKRSGILSAFTSEQD